MKPINTILFLFWAAIISAQPIFRHPFYTYLGSSLDFTKISINGGIPYDGIGKKTYLEGLPENVVHSMIKSDLPTSNLVDAFGVVLPRFSSKGKGDVFFQTDRFGNLSGRLNHHFKIKNKIRFKNELNYQKRWKKDKNKNGFADYFPGQRFYWNPSATYRFRQFSLNGHFLFLNTTEWGGTTGSSDEIKNGQFGFSKKGQHINFLLNGKYKFNNEKQKLNWNLIFNNVNQKRQLPNHFYNGDEKMYDAMVQYQHDLDFSNFNAGIHFHDEKTDEYLNENKIVQNDRFIKLFGGYTIAATDRLVLKPKINMEARKNDWSFLPAFQIDYGFIKDRLSVSVYGMTGKRLNRPINFYMDGISLANEINIGYKKFEESKKIGTALIAKGNGPFTLKLIAEHTRFKNKALLVKDGFSNNFSFVSLNKTLSRQSLESILQTSRHISGNSFTSHIIYKWESFNENDLIPFQNSHAMQFKLQYRRYGKLGVTLHHTFKSPQNLNAYMDIKTKCFNRTDLHFDFDFEQLFNAGKDDFISNWYVGLHFDNFINYYKNKKTMLETGLLLFPFQEDILWNDPSLGNVRVEVGYKF